MYNNKPFYAAFIACSCLFACSDDPIGDDRTTAQDEAGSYIRLTLACPGGSASTRANPTGGEAGDGEEPGEAYENRIDDLTLLFYQADAQSNAPATTPIQKIFYFDRSQMEGDNRTEPVAIDLPAGDYDLLAITNTGSGLRDRLAGLTLGSVRDYLLTEAWQEDEGAYSRFVMTSDGHTTDRVTLCGNPVDNPADVTLEVERLAARIDYRAQASIYDVDDPLYGRAVASVTGATIINRLSAGSYLLKRVVEPDADEALTDASAVTYLGDELPVEGGVQRNYVVDPWSLVKTPGNTSRNAFNPDAPGTGNQPAAALYDAYYTSFDGDADRWEAAVTPGDLIGDWRRIGYTLENTMSREAQLDAYRTMVVFAARYTPDGYTEGETFYRVRDRLFSSRTEAEAYAEETNGLVREYRDGICYYVWRVRHSNDDATGEAGIMEYAIVRNNIYRLLVTGFDGLGDEVPFPPEDPDEPTDPEDPEDPDEPDDPDPDEPDPEPEPDPEHIQVTVSVEEWTTLPKEDIYL